MKRFILTITIICITASSIVAQDIMTPEMLWRLGRVSGVSVSSDGQSVLYGVSRYELEENTGNRDLYIINKDGQFPFVLTSTSGSEYAETWRPDGKKVACLYQTDNGAQLFELSPDGSSREQITDIEGGITNYAYSPAMNRILITRNVKLDPTANDIHPDLPMANARIIDDLMYRHWDGWHDYEYSHIFFADYEPGKILGEWKDIMPNEKFDSPLNPFGGIEEISWDPDGTRIAYTCKKSSGRDYAISTDSDIYLYNVNTGGTENVTEGMAGYDKEPVFSPTGDRMLWSSMKRAGFEADRNRIFIYDFNTSKKEEVTKGLDRSANHPQWDPNGNTLYFLAGDKATYQVFKLSLENGDVQKITDGQHNYYAFDIVNEDQLIGARADMNHPVELFKINVSTGEQDALTTTNDKFYNNLKTGKVEERWVKTTDGKDMLVWVIFPPDFDPEKKYPALLYCQGGPQSAVSQFFSYRWNFQLMAANGYIIVAPNRRGLPSFGREWNDQISKDWGGQNMKDYLSAIDELKKEPYIDENRLGSVGASYGGYSVYWLAGKHEKRFKAFIAHCGIFNLESWYGSTEELFFANWDIGGPYWEEKWKNDYSEFSPHRFVQDWDAPIMVIHSEKDFRVPIGEGLQAFQAAQLNGVPSRFLYFPTESHWVLSPQNGVLWHREFFKWLDKWLKD